jgi:hypothetical protein
MEQQFNINETVKVGFLSLIVKSKVKTKIEHGYILVNLKGTKLYFFTPYGGVKSISVDDAKELIEATKSNEISVSVSDLKDQAARQQINNLFN